MLDDDHVGRQLAARSGAGRGLGLAGAPASVVRATGSSPQLAERSAVHSSARSIRGSVGSAQAIVPTVCSYHVMSNGWQMPGHTPTAAGEWRLATGRSQVCGVPPLQNVMSQDIGDNGPTET